MQRSQALEKTPYKYPSLDITSLGKLSLAPGRTRITLTTANMERLPAPVHFILITILT
jgi:hypothetical protein